MAGYPPAWGSGIAGESLDGIPFYIDWISSDGGFGVEPVEGTKAGLRVHCLESRGEERNQGLSIAGLTRLCSSHWRVQRGI